MSTQNKDSKNLYFFFIISASILFLGYVSTNLSENSYKSIDEFQIRTQNYENAVFRLQY